MTLVESSPDDKIIDFEVFKHYMAILQEKNYIRQLKVINLKTQRESIHLFDSPQEVNPADDQNQVCDFFDVELEDNNTFDAVTLKYRLSTPNTPQRVFNFNMGTKKADQIFFEQYKNLTKPQNIQCEKINVTMRDGFEVPLVMSYDKTYFNEKSPWIMFTKGAISQKSDLQFDNNKISLMNRGMCLCYPLVRGTKYFDDGWYHSGIGEKKLTHVMDFIDSAIYLKEKGLAQKIGVLGIQESGSITALASAFSEPLLFDCTVAHNPVTDLIQHLFHDIEQRNTIQSAQEFEEAHFRKLQEFGDIQNKDFYEALQLISPYHIPYKGGNLSLQTDLLITQDESYLHSYHGRKLMCKLRDVMSKDKKLGFVFYKEFPEKMFTEEEKSALQYSFIINSLLFR
ncbi:hypothetical protein FGO68_gene9908 [Halteria grandinella]|uniref:Prolyl endopeptidase-like n=1 Tax=Halteria grandinella TaxID=5974 RepID=A0A8J8NDX7_HALGN|nr:hypothetical protein FGO68_gene9908 [Halteria grandinella]